jgi:V-type H+-transporting ATPase proteolipid subunit
MEASQVKKEVETKVTPLQSAGALGPLQFSPIPPPSSPIQQRLQRRQGGERTTRSRAEMSSDSSSWARALVQISPYAFSAIGIAVSLGVSVLGAAW